MRIACFFASALDHEADIEDTGVTRIRRHCHDEAPRPTTRASSGAGTGILSADFGECLQNRAEPGTCE